MKPIEHQSSKAGVGGEAHPHTNSSND